jgi:hypothetical protein
VSAQTYQPQLRTPYDVVLPRNEIIAQTRAAQRMSGYNPAAQSIIASQAYEPLNRIAGEEFRMNQALKDQVYSGNQATMNDAQLKNLGIRDQQYVRQAEAKSNTKAMTQAALNSVSAKYQQNKLENRNLQAYENLYNFRYDNRGRAINWNGLPEFNMQGNGPGVPRALREGEEYIYDSKGQVVDIRRVPTSKVTKAASSKEKRNGAIVRAIKNL